MESSLILVLGTATFIATAVRPVTLQGVTQLMFIINNQTSTVEFHC